MVVHRSVYVLLIQVLSKFPLTKFPVERYYRDAKVTEIYEGTGQKSSGS